MDKAKRYHILSLALMLLAFLLCTAGLVFFFFERRWTGAAFIFVAVVWLKVAMHWARLALLEGSKRS
jgi:Na+/phosphate symporter